MPRNLPHLLIKNPNVQNEGYQGRRGGGPAGPSPVTDRAAHANALLAALAILPDIEQQGLPGVYLRVDGRPGEPMITDSLGKSGLTLLQVKQVKYENKTQNFKQATVFASQNGIQALHGKITQYNNSAHKHTRLIDSIGSLRQAALQDLWHSKQPLPADSTDAVWEIWLRREFADSFFREASAQNFHISTDRLDFPDDIVIIGSGGYQQLSNMIAKSGAVRFLAPVATPAFFLEDSTFEDNQGWLNDLIRRTSFPNIHADTSYAAIMDYGIGRSHPLIQPALNASDRYTAEPSWGVETGKSHGTQMAGIALYGDLMQALQSPDAITISHRLESIKILPDSGANPDDFYGKITINGIKAAETGNTGRLRTYIMAITTSEDTPHDGAPTSWSAALDSLASGSEALYANNTVSEKRLIIVSGGNVAEEAHNPPHPDYFRYCDKAEIESPAQAWNVITVGAYTEMTRDGATDGIHPLAPTGDLSPASRTASWDSYWPIKPDVVMEGGNYVMYPGRPSYVSKHDDVSLLTTAHNYPTAVFSAFGQTSAATALAGKALAELRSEYPQFWPETIRALFIGSARWTDQMKSRATSGMKGLKGLSKRYGYGVPNIQRARHSAENDCTLIIQDSITPYDLSTWKTGQYKFGGLKLYELPWPQTLLRSLANAEIEIRVALSTFAIPNPAHFETENKYQYASHALRFDLIRINETPADFIRRVSNDRGTDSSSASATPANIDWEFGPQQRNVGSLQMDWIKGKASDFARRNYLAVYPVQGWWRFKQAQAHENREARFALTIEINAENCASADIYTAVKNQIQIPIPIATAP